jgi:protein-tyrosine-phosphatase
MKLLYVCEGGARRSPALAAYTNHFRDVYGLDSLEAHCAAANEGQFRKYPDPERQRIVTEELARDRRYEPHIEALRTKEFDLSIRIGVLLLLEGVEDIANHRKRFGTEEIINQYDLVLVTSPRERDEVRKRVKAGDRIYMVKEFLSYPGDDLIIPDVVDQYVDENQESQLRTDRVLCDELRGFAHQVLDKISREGFPTLL